MTQSRRYKKLDERDFTGQIIELAHIYHWRVAHFRAAITQHGWRTPVQADGAGFPDLVLVRPPKCLFVELKSDTGQISRGQEEWLRELGACLGISVCIWRPSQWEEIVEILARNEIRKIENDNTHL